MAASDLRRPAAPARLRSAPRSVAGDIGPDGLIPTTDQFGTALADIVRCAACGHMQLDAMPADEVLGEAYGDAASEDYVDEEAGQRETARAVLDRIERHTAPGPSARPRLLGRLPARRGPRARLGRRSASSPATFASAYARERLGLDVRTTDLFTRRPAGGSRSTPSCSAT